jgi:outer membrane receptor protein involved in Fe transport
MTRIRIAAAIGASIAAMAIASSAQAQASGDAAATGDESEIIVTANKREQSINDVGLTIQAATAETLANRGITNVSDLTKLVPGFTATQSTFATPIYTLRGIGLYDATVGASPAVAIYTDQISRNFPMMSDALELDIERVEVLKGPQGTLFGQSSTGGAINYIVGKPTDTLESGGTASFERFGKLDVAGFISGPLSDTLKARLAVRGISGGAWQYSGTRPDDENGATRKLMGRLSLDFTPSETVRVQASLTAARDRSDTQAPQYVNSFYNIYSTASLAAANANPATANPFGYADDALYAQLTTVGEPGYRDTHVPLQSVAVARMNGVGDINAFRNVIAANTRALLGTAPANGRIRVAEWTPGFLQGARNTYWQGTLRMDFELSDGTTLTTLSAYAKSKLDRTIDLDGTVAESLNIPSYGNIETINQEIRLSGQTDTLNWIVGANYDSLKTSDNNDYILYDYIGSNPFGVTAPALGTPGPVLFTNNLFDTKLRTIAVFANAEYELSDLMSISAGIRYTDNKQKATYCYNDPASDTLQGTSTLFTVISQLFGGAPGTFANGPGDCFPTGPAAGANLTGISTLTPVPASQKEDNVSYRVGLNYKLNNGGLLYATVSQGYKAGVFSNIGASQTSQYVPAKQEKILAFEGGFKLPLAANKFQLNGAAFYYDYTDKQTRAKISALFWGLLEKLVNVPKSRVYGIEGEFVARPVDGLTFSASATFLKSKVTSDFSTANGAPVYNSMGFTGNFKGSKLPFTPEFTANADIQYEFEMGNLKPFVGATAVHQGKSSATYENAILRADFFKIPSYTTVDLRAGVGADDDRWKLMLYGRNVFDKYYIVSPTFYHDAYFNIVGRPATYGVQVSMKY